MNLKTLRQTLATALEDAGIDYSTSAFPPPVVIPPTVVIVPGNPWIAPVTIGIAVVNAIHYIYRFRVEFHHTGDYSLTLRVCHATIGRAVFYTSATIIFGFSILAWSNFWPTVYFGVLIGLAMTMALAAALTLLPRLILAIKPFRID